MFEILDPEMLTSYYSPRNIAEMVQEIVDEGHLKTQLAPDMVQDTLRMIREKSDDITEVADSELMRHIVHGTLNGILIDKVMSDNKGRSESHIAAEVCTLNFNLAVISREKKLEGLEAIGEVVKTQRPNYWTPFENIHVPTIDGRHENEPQVTQLKNGRFALTPAMHMQWLGVFKNFVLPSAAQRHIRQIEPPFLLSSEKIIAGTDPAFYILVHPPVPVEPAPTSRELIPA